MKKAILFLLLLGGIGGSPSIAQVITRGNSGVNAQTGTSYTFVLADSVKLVTFNNAASTAVTLPAASTFGAGVVFSMTNLGNGLVTITPASGTINGGAFIAVGANGGCDIYNDGTNYFTVTANLVSPSGDARLGSVGTFNVEEWVGTVQYPTIAAAISGASNGTLIRVPAGTFQISGTQTISLNNLSIVGEGDGLSYIQITSATANYFSVSGNDFELSNLTLNSSVTRTAGFVIVNGAGAAVTPTSWDIHDLTLQDTYGGFQLYANNSNSIADVYFRRITQRTTIGQHSGSLYVIGGGSATVGGITIDRSYTPTNGAIFDAPQVIIDTLADTVQIDHFQVGYSVGIAQTQPVIKFSNLGASTPPKFIRIHNMAIESGGSASTADCVKVDFVADLDISDSYFANCGNEAINISGGNNLNGPIRFHHNWIGNNQKGGLYISTAITANADIEIDHNSFNNNSINTTNTFDDIQIVANTVGFKIIGNHFGNQVFHSANLSRYGVNIIAGTSTAYTYALNSCETTSFGSGCLVDGGTGANKRVEFPNLTFTWTGSSGSQAPVLTMFDNAGRCGYISGPESTLNMQIGTCSAGGVFEMYSANKVLGAQLDGSQNFIFRGPSERIVETASLPAGVASAAVLNADSADHMIHYNPNNVGDQKIPRTCFLIADSSGSASATLANITWANSCVFPVKASTVYSYECDVQSTSTNAAGGLFMGITGPVTPVASNYTLSQALSATTTGYHNISQTTAYSTTGAGVVAQTITTTWPAHFAGTFENGTTAGTLSFQFANGSATGSTVVKRGSFCTVQ